MKKISITTFLVFLLFTLSQAQNQIILQPNSVDGIDATVTSYFPDKNFGTENIGQIYCWSMNGSNVTTRFYLNFDLSAIPSNAIINKAWLSLFESHELSVTEGHSNISGSNRSFIRKVTSPWSEQTLTWNNQPSYTETNQVEIPESDSAKQNYLDLNITQLIEKDNTSSFGLVIMLENEQKYRSMLFASSDNESSAKRPKLLISYTLPDTDTCRITVYDTIRTEIFDTIHIEQSDSIFQKNIVLQPNSAEGIDATVTSFLPNKNFGTENIGQIYCWSMDGSIVTTRFYLNFDLSAIPSYAKISKAKLSLFESHELSVTEGHSNLSGSNRSFIRKVTSPWSEQTITWNNQPSYTETNQIEIPESDSANQNYLDLDITQLIEKDNASDYGMVIMLENEETYRSMLFASSDNENLAKRPKLSISYTLPKTDTCRITVYDTIRTEIFDTIRFEVHDTLYEKVAVSDTLVIDAWFTGNDQIKALSTIKVYPNPTKKDLIITIADYKKLIGYSIKIVDVNGKYIYATYIDKNDFLINLDLIANRGLYLLQIVDDKLNIVETKKIILD